MMNFEEYLKNQAVLHPAMEPQDAVKMCYQAAFGAEHAFSDPERARCYLEQELESVEADAALPICESISEHICRVNLAAWKAKALPADWLFRMFVSAKAQSGDIKVLLSAVSELACRGELPFSAGRWNEFLAGYPVDAPHPVHHSDGYRAAEKPAYRIVPAAYTELLPLLEKMAECRGGVVAIDGRAASGKTTLAQTLARVTGAGIVYMDDFFLPMEKRTPERLSAPGGNVDYERFASEVLPGLRGGEAFSYPRFDCSVMAISGSREVAVSPWRIVEGSYSHHPELGDYMDIRVFRTVDPETQKKRILERNGEAMLRRFESAWIPMEERYFSHFAIEEKANFVI